MTVKHTLTAVLVSLALPAAALAQPSSAAPASGASQAGQQFLQQVRKDSNNEIEGALMAEQRSNNPAVKAYARLLIVDHTSLVGEMAALQPSNTASQGSEGSSTGTEAQANHARSTFGREQGAQFDHAFIDQEVTSNQQSLSSWEHEATVGGEVGTFAKIGLAMQRQHLMLGQAVQMQLSKGQAAGTSG